MNFTTAIFASGKGSRMKELSEQIGLPKHLFPLGDENITSRLVRQVQNISERIVCIVGPNQGELFQKHLEHTSAEVIENTGEGFMPLFEILHKETQGDVLITTGDLVFTDSAIEKTLSHIKPRKTQLITDEKWGRKMGFPIRFALMGHELLGKISGSSFSPEKASSVFCLIVGDILDNGFPKFGTIETLANLNTPQDYEELVRKFEEKK